MKTIKEIRKNRLEKIKEVSQVQKTAYLGETSRTHQIKEALDDFNSLCKLEKEIILVGRLRSLRGHGGLSFLDIEDGTGKIQGFLKKNRVGEDSYNFFIDNFDIGDFLEVRGILFTTQKGQKSIEIADYKMLTKSLLPLPEKWHGIQDIELRLRHRYLDLIMNPEEREIFKKKSIFWKSMRDFLEKEGFMEVDTAALEPVAGGADANPFITKHDALKTDFYLRISLELPLKKFIIGGFEKV